MTFGERMKARRKEMHITQREMAEKLGVTNSAISTYEKGIREPSIETIKKIAQILDVKVAALMGDVPIRPDAGIKIPILGSVVAGIPISAVTDILGYEEISPKMAGEGEFFALRVKGDSMLPWLRDGDIAIIKQQSDVESGDVAVVLINGDEATIKQVKKSKDGIMLYGFNTSVFTPIFYSNKDIEDLPVRIIGKLVESRRPW